MARVSTFPEVNQVNEEWTDEGRTQPGLTGQQRALGIGFTLAIRFE